MDWKKLLGSITASVDEELRLRNAYLLTENCLLRQQLSGRVHLTNSDRKILAELGQQLGKKALEEIATIAKPDTILAWHRTCAAQQGNRAPLRQSVGRPRIAKEIEALVVRMARENRSWGYDRIVGALANLGYTLSDQSVGNILKQHGIPPAPERKKTTTWHEFIRCHLDSLLATNFFTSEVWSWCGLMVSLLLWFIHYSCCQVSAVRMTLHHHMRWLLSLLLRSLDVHILDQRWIQFVMSGRWRSILYAEEGLEHIVPVCAFPDDRSARSQDRGKVMALSAASSSQIRDGPIRRRHRRSELRILEDREAA
jgi:transposase